MKETEKEERRYTYEEVKAILCDGCKFGVPDYRSCGDAWYHTLNGEHFKCAANKWRERSHDQNHQT